MIFGKNKKNKEKLDENSMKLGVALIAEDDSKSNIAEQYRTIRTNLKFSFIDPNFKTLAFVSSAPSEGKSTVSANMAVTWAEDDKNVLLVDADLRRPTVHQTFGVSNNQGLSTIITAQTQEVNISQMISKTKIPGLSVLTSGPIPPNPAELLNSNRFKQLLSFLKQKYDFVILDAPPVNVVTDSQIIASEVDGVALVVPQGIATTNGVEHAVNMLKKVNANILGAIMNRYSEEDSGTYYGGYYGGYYGKTER